MQHLSCLTVNWSMISHCPAVPKTFSVHNMAIARLLHGRYHGNCPAVAGPFAYQLPGCLSGRMLGRLPLQYVQPSLTKQDPGEVRSAGPLIMFQINSEGITD